MKFDFFYMHSTNSSLFFSAFVKQPWIAPKTKARLLEWKARADLGLYLSRQSANLDLDEIKNYKPREPSTGGDPWQKILARANKYEDDGHLSKLIRAIANGKAVSAPYETKDSFRIKGDMWLQLAHMAIDSVEYGGEPRWVRSAGFPEAWEDVKDRQPSVL